MFDFKTIIHSILGLESNKTEDYHAGVDRDCAVDKTNGNGVPGGIVL
jgi:hypothetical protein